MTPDSLMHAVLDTDVMLPLLGSLISGAMIGAKRASWWASGAPERPAARPPPSG